MKTLFILALLFPPSVAYARTPEWYCTTQASNYSKDRILACGVGEADTESAARVEALEASKTEFLAICQAEDCAEWSFRPKRTQCTPENGQWKCLRAVEFTPGPNSRAATAENPTERAWAVLSEISGAPSVGTNFGFGVRREVHLGLGLALYATVSGGLTMAALKSQTYGRAVAGVALHLGESTYLNAGFGGYVPGVGPTFATGEVALGFELLRVNSVALIAEGGVRTYGSGNVRPALSFGFSW